VATTLVVLAVVMIGSLALRSANASGCGDAAPRPRDSRNAVCALLRRAHRAQSGLQVDAIWNCPTRSSRQRTERTESHAAGAPARGLAVDAANAGRQRLVSRSRIAAVDSRRRHDPSAHRSGPRRRRHREPPSSTRCRPMRSTVTARRGTLTRRCGGRVATFPHQPAPRAGSRRREHPRAADQPPRLAELFLPLGIEALTRIPHGLVLIGGRPAPARRRPSPRSWMPSTVETRSTSSRSKIPSSTNTRIRRAWWSRWRLASTRPISRRRYARPCVSRRRHRRRRNARSGDDENCAGGGERPGTWCFRRCTRAT
jgi:hypothetical protein